MVFRKFEKKETDYATHDIYRYPGKFIPQIPRFLIQKFSEKYDVVLDPFCGSGTTLVEANLLHRNSYGIDINPIARLVTKVKTKKINVSKGEISPLFSDISAKMSDSENMEIENECKKFKYNYLFNSENLMQILKIRKEIYKNDDEELKNFLLVCLLSIVKHCANIDEHKIRNVRKRKGVFDVSEIFKNLVYENLKKVTHINTDVFAEVIGSNAKEIFLNDNTIDLVITSPPYLNALNYREIHKVEMALIDEKIDDKNYIGVDKEIEGDERDKRDEGDKREKGDDKSDESKGNVGNVESKKFGAIEIYFKDMEKAISEIYRVLKSKGNLCMIIDKDRRIRNVRFKFASELIKRAKICNFVLEDRFYRYTTKENKAKGERILIFRKI